MKKAISVILASVLLANNFAYAQTSASMTLVQHQKRYNEKVLPVLKEAQPAFNSERFFSQTALGASAALLVRDLNPEIIRAMENITDEEMLKGAVEYSRKYRLNDLEMILAKTQPEDIYEVLTQYEIDYNKKRILYFKVDFPNAANGRTYFKNRAENYFFLEKSAPKNTIRSFVEEIKGEIITKGNYKNFLYDLSRAIRLNNCPENIKQYARILYGKGKGASKFLLKIGLTVFLFAEIDAYAQASAGEQAKIQRLGENMALFPQMDEITLNKIEKEEPELAASIAAASDGLYRLSTMPKEDIKNILTSAERDSKEQQKEFNFDKYNSLNKNRTVKINTDGIGRDSK